MTSTGYVSTSSALRPVLGGPDVPFVVTPSDPTLVGMTQVFETQFATIDPTKFKVYDKDAFSVVAGQRQAYMAANVGSGTGASDGATNGTSLRLTVNRETTTLGATTYNFTAGLLNTKSAGFYFPRYGRTEFRCKTPHGQGLWPSIWINAKNGGSSVVELDIMEYFHAQNPGKNSVTLHATDNTGKLITNKYTNNGNAANNKWGRTFFEAPTYTPGWHVFACDYIPVTDSTGATPADATKPSNYVRVRGYLDGAKCFDIVDTTALYWSTNAGDTDNFWNCYLQGAQVGGNWVGEIDGTLGYSDQLSRCLISGTPPNACATSLGGYKVQRAQLGGVASTTEVDWLRVYKYTP